MKRAILSLLTLLGVLSRSNFAGAATALDANTVRDLNKTCMKPTGVC